MSRACAWARSARLLEKVCRSERTGLIDSYMLYMLISGVEALFKSISALLVEKREKIERERTLRHKDSIMLTDEATRAKDAKTTTKGCCV